MSKIVLDQFSVERGRWGDHKGKYECEARFSQGKNNFTIHLDNEMGDLIVSLCRGKIAEASAEALENLRIMASEDSGDE